MQLENCMTCFVTGHNRAHFHITSSKILTSFLEGVICLKPYFQRLMFFFNLPLEGTGQMTCQPTMQFEPQLSQEFFWPLTPDINHRENRRY